MRSDNFIMVFIIMLHVKRPLPKTCTSREMEISRTHQVLSAVCSQPTSNETVTELLQGMCSLIKAATHSHKHCHNYYRAF